MIVALAVILALAIELYASSVSSAASWKRCRTASASSSGVGILNLRAKGVGCTRANRVARGPKSDEPLGDSYEFLGFSCQKTKSKNSDTSQWWSCVNGKKRVKYRLEIYGQ